MTAQSSSRSIRLSDNGLLLLLAVGGALLHTLLNGQYGFHRDELDIIMNARQLDWGYVAYPPLTPFIARVGLELFGNSLQGLRLFSALGQGLVIILAGLMARDMGGKRGAQVMAAIATFIAPVALTAGTLIQYMAFDYVWWVLMAFFTVRLLATDDARYWLGIGASIGLGMQTKFTIAFWVIGLIVAVLLTPARKYLRSKWLWLGAGLALLIYLPNLIWQIQHQFISLDFLSSIHARDLQWGRGDSFLIEQLYTTTNPFTLPLWIAGLMACLFSASLKRFRLLAWMFLTTFVLFLISRGRAYYTGPAYVMLLAAGSVWFEQWLAGRTKVARRIGLGVLWSLLAVGGVVGIVLVKPVAPINSDLWKVTSDVSGEVIEMVGWQDLTEQVAEIYRGLPEADKARAAILAGNYGEAGALDLYGSEYDLPRIISGANSLWYRGYGDIAPETVIAVGFDRGYADSFFRDCQPVGRVTNRYNVANEETTRHTGLYICHEPRQPWDEMWQRMQWFQ
ncbi:MAG TPA: glycosyltransferase family 39 protein [Anaerolineae bacterium]|nr:glycosyltransferase family 39 protein [Anaerolineae bacterium]